ncbi:TPA: hypothetical protein ACSE6Y_003710 [Acinetobacter baumannii]|uniref:hypothetical protein n=1 Tax=Acinetobacter pittii TaxID=48296 RepID=UPI000838525C|nr:hypothetical protein [Acinetobacter pittii]OCY51623.1 hypothetical protein BFR81_09890 [Acinetobacter pittii]
MDELVAERNKPGIVLFNEQRLHRDAFIDNPETGNRYFGYIADIKNYPEGYIVLKWGLHRKLHSGFGCLHIWLQHQHCFKSQKLCEVVEDVPKLVNRVLRPGTRVLEQHNGDERLAVLQSSVGTIILEWRSGYYSIVTLYLRKDTRGTVIGAVKRLPEVNILDK